MMKTIILLVFMLAGAGASAQSYYTNSSADSNRFLGFYEASAGPFFTGGVSQMSQNVESGWHTDPAFAYTFGGVLALELNELVGVQFAIAYDSRELYSARDNDSVVNDVGVQYLSIQPSLRVYWLTIGLAFNMPMSGASTVTIKKFNADGDYTENRNIANSDIASTTDIHGGLSIPVYRGESGTLHLLLSASYPLAKVLSGNSSFDAVGGSEPKPDLKPAVGTVGDGPLPAIEAGVSYQFDLTQLM
jgi:hypothetical protein